MRPPRLHNPCRTASSSQNRRCSPCMCHLLQGCQLPNGQPLTFRLWEGEWMAEAVPAFLAGAGADTATADKVALRRRAGADQGRVPCVCVSTQRPMLYVTDPLLQNDYVPHACEALARPMLHASPKMVPLPIAAAGRGRCCDWQRTCPKLRPTTARSAQTRPTPSVAQRVPALEPARNPL